MLGKQFVMGFVPSQFSNNHPVYLSVSNNHPVYLSVSDNHSVYLSVSNDHTVFLPKGCLEAWNA